MTALLLLLLATPLVQALLVGAVVMRLKPSWPGRRIALVSALPIPAIVAGFSGWVWADIATSSEVQKCGFQLASAKAALVLALIWFLMAFAVTWLLTGSRRAR